MLHSNEWPCIQCGYCCTKSPCGCGDAVSREQGNYRCKYLTEDKLCSIYQDILENKHNQYNWAWLSPAFNTGCCSSFLNTTRLQKIIDDNIEEQLWEVVEAELLYNLKLDRGGDKDEQEEAQKE